MKYVNILVTLCCILCLINCGKGKQTSQADLFDYSEPADLSDILQTYDWYQHDTGEDKDSILKSKIGIELPGDECFLIGDTAFVLRVPEYADSQQPFLAYAEDFYNSLVLSWNVWSNFEVWYRGHTSDLLVSDEKVRKSIEKMSADIINDREVRNAAQNLKDSLFLIMKKDVDEWDKEFTPMDWLVSYGDVVEGKAYRYYDDEESFVAFLDSVNHIAEGMTKDRFQRYLDANEDVRVGVMLNELATCRNFDEQCSLWRNWANCEKSIIDDEWIVAVGCKLMESGNYSPILNRIWITWRAICQSHYFGISRDSFIPNRYYNEYRKMCFLSCLKRIANHPDDIFAMNCAAAIGGRTNLNRFGQYFFGNDAVAEEAMMLPGRHHHEEHEDADETE